jgi:FkbM family methyltransferase
MRALAFFLNQFDRPFFRPFARRLVQLVYKIKGINAHVAYHNSFKLWEYHIGDNVFVTNRPAWFSSREYYLNTFIKYAGNDYLPGEGDIVIDVGAGVGEETLTMANLVGGSGHVYAVEANPKTFEVLRYICEKNDLKNVTVLNIAISDTEGHISIEDDDNYGVQNSIHGATTSNGLNVPAVSLDTFIQQNSITRVDFLKVNIEGAEKQLLQGIHTSFNKIKRMAISCHDFRFNSGESEYFKTFDFVVSVLKQNGFQIKVRKTGDEVVDSYVYAVSPHA